MDSSQEKRHPDNQSNTPSKKTEHDGRETLVLPSTDQSLHQLAPTEDKYETRTDPQKGGMAVVWRATDSLLKREVAFKELSPERADDPASQRMFLREAQVTGQLEHPNIVPVYELGMGDRDRRPFYTMRYVNGTSLREIISEHHRLAPAGYDPLALSRLLRIVLQICNAVSYAHSRGIIHRDLKPENVMVGPFGEVVLLDWGLAKFIGTAESDLPAIHLSHVETVKTVSGDRKGTPAYWAPEQAEGRPELVDFRTDVYGLGGILFEILTGSIPNDEMTGDDLSQSNFDAHSHQRREELLSPDSPLHAICAKALADQRSDRYSTVTKFAQDIECWLVDEPVSSYQESSLERLTRTGRRYRAAISVASIGLVAVGVIAASVFLQQWSGFKQRHASEVNSLTEFASMIGTKVASDVEVLRQDTTFLSNLAETRQILTPQETTSNEPDASEKPVNSLARQRLSAVFREFLNEKPAYMQVRLLGTDGSELVRVDRSLPGGPPKPVEQAKLQNKGSRDYFKNTMKLNQGDWYLSPIELNQDFGKKQKELPVIRGAVPVFLDGAAAPTGMIVINLHFQELVEEMRRFESLSSRGILYLTDESGRFLYHPNSELGFCFERNLDYRIQHLYTEVNDCYRRETSTSVIRGCTAQVGLLVRPVAPVTIQHARRAEYIYRNWKERLTSAMISTESKSSEVNWKVSDEADAVLYGVGLSDLDEIADGLEQESGLHLTRQLLPADTPTHRQTVYFNRLNLDVAKRDRYLGLILAFPEQAFFTEAIQRILFWSALGLLVVGLIAARFASRPETVARMA